jgi:GNAT superfamily N-acetyltransferase
MVAETPGLLLGYVTLHTTYETTYASRGAYVGDLFVRPERRRLGIGRSLLAAAARAVRDEGGGHLWWTALPKNAAGQAFYARLGAKPETLIAYALADGAFDTLAAPAR